MLMSAARLVQNNRRIGRVMIDRRGRGTMRTKSADDLDAAEETRRAVSDAHHSLLRPRLDLVQPRRNPRVAD